MKVSQINDVDLLTNKQIYDIVYGGVADEGKSADVALLLGCYPKISRERAAGAARLYKAGRVKYIIPSGGVKWEENGASQSEAELMRDVLISEGVPDSAIIMENNATTTKENMLFSTIEIERALRFENVKSAVVVTSAEHITRSMALAKWLLPRHLEVSAYPANAPYPIEAMTVSEELLKRMKTEVKLLKELSESKLIDQIEY